MVSVYMEWYAVTSSGADRHCLVLTLCGADRHCLVPAGDPLWGSELDTA